MGNYLEIVEGIDSIQYGTSKLHRLLYNNENIGLNCENLTIIILSYNRADATIKLLKSIEKECKNFKGKILICDNNSEKKCFSKIKKFVNELKLNCKIVKYNENLGVAKGRNTAIQYVDTDWIMFLDNDIYFIKNIFPETQKAISQLGCKFINLPLLNEDKETLFTYGGHIYVTLLKNGVHVGNGSTYKQKSIKELSYIENTLATFLFGGSAILNKDAFVKLGKFDEGMFIGFEDLDFSIRLFNEGMKIRML